MTDYFKPKPLDYLAFVVELRQLIDEARGLETIGRWDANDNVFRRWRAKLIDLLAQIRKAGYKDVRCEVGAVEFAYYGPGDAKYAARHFERHLDDTLIEIQLIVDNYDKYGDPKEPETEAIAEPATAPEATPTLLPPEKVTIPWIWKNVSIPLLVGGSIFLAAVFAFGLTLGGTKAGQSVVGMFTSPASAPASAPDTRVDLATGKGAQPGPSDSSPNLLKMLASARPSAPVPTPASATSASTPTASQDSKDASQRFAGYISLPYRGEQPVRLNLDLKVRNEALENFYEGTHCLQKGSEFIACHYASLLACQVDKNKEVYGVLLPGRYACVEKPPAKVCFISTTENSFPEIRCMPSMELCDDVRSRVIKERAVTEIGV